jgi:predicted DNA-binding transcriptional regulator AlpA
MSYLGFRDLLKRWVYTRQGVYKLMDNADFPEPQFTINGGHTKVWHSTDIKSYEDKHPELTSEEKKRRKVAAYAGRNLKKKASRG